MANQVKVLIVGAAFSADLHMDGYSRCTDVAKIVAICDKATDRAHDIIKRYGLTDVEVYDDAYKAIDSVDCDVVDICLPNFLHHDIAIYAFEKGKNVITEKPIATTLSDAEEMLEASRKAGKKLYYAEDWLFAPALNKALELVKEGAIGEQTYVRARECHCGSHSPFAQKIEFCGGGSMIHLGCHPIGFMLAKKNNEWTELVAMTSGGLENNMWHKSMEGEDWAAVMIKFKDGTSALLEANYLACGGMEDSIEIYGKEGKMAVDLTFSSPIQLYSIPGVSYTVEKAEITTGWSRPAVDEKYNLGYIGEIRHFMECVRDNKDAKVGLRGVDGLEILKVVNYIYKSAKEGIKIVNPDLK